MVQVTNIWASDILRVTKAMGKALGTGVCNSISGLRVLKPISVNFPCLTSTSITDDILIPSNKL